MPRQLKDVLPGPEHLLAMEPEELAGFLLEYLNELPSNDAYLNLASLTLSTGPLGQYAGNQFGSVAEAVVEALSVLISEGMIAPRPGDFDGKRIFVTRRGRRFRAHADLEAYRRAGLLNEKTLDLLLAEKVVPLFRRGDYDTAVFAAFKEVEVRVRDVSELREDLIGVGLMQEAFKDAGPLANPNQDKGERVALLNTFAGAIGLFKNPGSHRAVNYRANDAAALIHFANYLLLIVETRRGW